MLTLRTKQNTSKINNLTLYCKELQKEQTEPKVSRRKNMIESRDKIEQKSKRENDKTGSQFFKR